MQLLLSGPVYDGKETMCHVFLHCGYRIVSFCVFRLFVSIVVLNWKLHATMAAITNFVMCYFEIFLGCTSVICDLLYKIMI
jgi:hypothetical protein